MGNLPRKHIHMNGHANPTAVPTANPTAEATDTTTEPIVYGRPFLENFADAERRDAEWRAEKNARRRRRRLNGGGDPHAKTTDKTTEPADTAARPTPNGKPWLAHFAERKRRQIGFKEAVRQGKELVQQIEANQWALGELADKVEPRYGCNTLKHFATAIGIGFPTLERCRSVYRAWKDIPAPGPELSYAVKRELAAHPDRAAIVAANPKLTKRQATKIMQAHKAKGSPPTSETANEATANVKGESTQDDLQGSVRLHANEALRHIVAATNDIAALVKAGAVADPGLVQLLQEVAAASVCLVEGSAQLQMPKQEPEEPDVPAAAAEPVMEAA